MTAFMTTEDLATSTVIESIFILSSHSCAIFFVLSCPTTNGVEQAEASIFPLGMVAHSAHSGDA